MSENEITKKYNELVFKIEDSNIYDGRGKGIDRYVCRSCGCEVLTRYKNKGVTPFAMKCEKCVNGTMVHEETVSEELGRMKSVFNGEPIKNWIRPTLKTLLVMPQGIVQHVLDGGLILE